MTERMWLWLRWTLKALVIVIWVVTYPLKLVALVLGVVMRSLVNGFMAGYEVVDVLFDD